MKRIISILLAATACATATAQTIRTLGYNATNGQIVANTGTNILSFTNRLSVVSSVYADVLSLSNADAAQGMTIAIVSDSLSSGYYGSFPKGSIGNGYGTFQIKYGTNDNEWGDALYLDRTNGGATARQKIGFSTNLNTLWTATNASNARSAVGLGLTALTNTSNVTTMRALAGSTNTNEPWSGSVELSDGTVAWLLTFSNGILTKLQEQ